MENLILKHGDLVKYLGMSPDLGRHWFAPGSLYMVATRPNGALYMQSSIGIQVDLVTPQGQLTDYADYIAKHACPVVLPKGI